MKKFLLTIAPLYVVLFVLMWISWRAEGVLAFLRVSLFVGALIFGLTKWIDFIDKHIKD